MSDKHPECPLYNPLNCKEYYNPKLCAFVRKDRACLKKKKPKQKDKDAEEQLFSKKGGCKAPFYFERPPDCIDRKKNSRRRL